MHADITGHLVALAGLLGAAACIALYRRSPRRGGPARRWALLAADCAVVNAWGGYAARDWFTAAVGAAGAVACLAAWWRNRRNPGKRKTSAMDRILRWERELGGWRIAEVIREAASGPEAHCTNRDCRGRIRYLALISAAAIAEDVAAGRTPDIEPVRPCSAAVLAAEAKMAGPL